MTPITSFKLELHLSDEDLPRLQSLALDLGFQRNHPKRQWLKSETQLAVIFVSRKLLANALAPKPDDPSSEEPITNYYPGES